MSIIINFFCRRVRGRCKVCYDYWKSLLSSKEACNKATKVSTVCKACPDQPFLCKKCFGPYHKI